jgi:hypothetical protein
MPTLKLTLRSLERPECLADEAEGTRLTHLVRQAVERGRAPIVAVTLREDRLDLISLAPVVNAKMPVQRFIAGLTRSTADGAGDVDAVGVIGVVQARQGGETPVPMAMAFLEWPDGRWWHWRALVGSDGTHLLDESETLNRAIDGDPLPSHFGRWWSLGRKKRFRMHLSRGGFPDEPLDDTTPTAPIVH